MATTSGERRSVAGEMHVDGRKIVGYAAVFGSVANLFDFDEIIERGAFRSALAHERAGETVALFNHDESKVLGRAAAGTLKMREDERGLWVEITPPNTSYGRDVRKMIERGDVRGQSMHFHIARNPRGERWDFSRGQDRPLRVVTAIERLDDVGPVTSPVYRDTSAALRSLTDWRQEADRLAAQRAKLARLEEKISRGA